MTVRESLTVHLKTGIARYQWTNPNNIILAKNGSRFLRELEIDLAVLGAEKANVNFTPQVNYKTSVLYRGTTFETDLIRTLRMVICLA